MKTQSILLRFCVLLIVALLLSSCKEDEESPDIIGEWSGTSVVRAECTSLNNNETITLDCDNDFCIKIKFLEGGTLENIYVDAEDGTDTSFGTYRLSGKTLTMCEGSACENYKISLESNILTLKSVLKEPASGCDLTLIFEKI